MGAQRDSRPETTTVGIQGGKLQVSELLGEFQGASSPFGDIRFPLPPHELREPGVKLPMPTASAHETAQLTEQR
ncbi:MAG: hypothetical protein DLM55_00255 [Acidimicrobiales bacterium]|nr:MAG: hypothetical protein DLM55_00255 [Acidimicrobiales bacterium]